MALESSKILRLSSFKTGHTVRLPVGTAAKKQTPKIRAENSRKLLGQISRAMRTETVPTHVKVNSVERFAQVDEHKVQKFLEQLLPKLAPEKLAKAILSNSQKAESASTELPPEVIIQALGAIAIHPLSLPHIFVAAMEVLNHLVQTDNNSVARAARIEVRRARTLFREAFTKKEFEIVAPMFRNADFKLPVLAHAA